MRSSTAIARALTRACLAAGALLLLVAHGYAIPPHAENHPRLFFDASDVPVMLAEIQADQARNDALLANNVRVTELMVEEADSIIDYWWGFSEIQVLAVGAQFAPSLLDSVAAVTLERAILRLVEVADPGVGLDLGTLGTAVRLLNLAWGFDCAFATASDSLRQVVVDEILGYLDEMPQNPYIQLFLYNPLVSNKGASIAASLLLAAHAIEPEAPGDPRIESARLFARDLLEKADADLFCADGSYREGAGYAAWTLRTLLPAREAQLRLAGEQLWDAAKTERQLEWFAYQLLPELPGGYLNRNDHNTSDFLISRHHSFIEWMTLRGQNPYLARWLLRRTSGDMGYSWGTASDPIATILWHRGGVDAPPALLADGRFFPDRGTYIHRRGWPGDPVEDSLLLTLEGGRFYGGHAQEDVGNFTLRALGHGFAIDHGAGTVAKQTESHNLTRADGIGQHNAGSSIGTDGVTEMLIDSGFCTAVRVDMTAAYTTYSPFNNADVPWEGWNWSWGYDGGNPMERAFRTLLLFHGDQEELPVLFLEDDMLKDDAEPHLFEWRMHMEEALAVTQMDSVTWEAVGANGSLHMRLHDPAPPFELHGVTPYDNQGSDPNSQVFSLADSAVNFTPLWQLSPLRSAESAPETFTEVSANGLLAVSLRGGRERRVLRRRGAEPLATANEILDGAWGVLESEAGLSRALLIDGRRLVSGGSVRIAIEPAGSAAYDGETVQLSDPELSFKIHAPAATGVFADGLPVPYERRGDYVSGPPPGDPVLPDVHAADSPLVLDAPTQSPGRPPFLFTARSGGGPLAIEIFDVRGRLQRRLDSGASQGERSFLWDGRDSRGVSVASGVYLVRLLDGSRSVRRKVLLLR